VQQHNNEYFAGIITADLCCTDRSGRLTELEIYRDKLYLSILL